MVMRTIKAKYKKGEEFIEEVCEQRRRGSRPPCSMRA